MSNISYKHFKYTSHPFIKANLNTKGSSVVCSIVLQKSARAFHPDVKEKEKILRLASGGTSDPMQTSPPEWFSADLQ
jgi:hypothetical protein